MKENSTTCIYFGVYFIFDWNYIHIKENFYISLTLLKASPCCAVSEEGETKPDAPLSTCTLTAEEPSGEPFEG